MGLRKLGAIALAFGFSFVTVSPAAAEGNTFIERSGNTFHKASCARNQRFGTARCFAHIVTDSAGRTRLFQPTGRPNFGFTGYTPADLQSAYKVTSKGSPSYTIAIVDAYGYPNAEADMNTYRAKYGLPACTSSGATPCFRKVNQNGNSSSYPATNVGWDQEQALDLDMVSAMCPNCRILLVQGTDASVANLGTAVNTAVAMGANAVSNSYGLTESAGLNDLAYTHAGVAITVSSGDSGYGVQFPANSANVIAVGGTSLTKASNARGWSETAWSGAGSGCSSVVAKPSWQHDGLCARRTVTDISAVADPNTGASVYGPTSSTASGWMIIGGTSLAAPLIAGVYGAAASTNVNAASGLYANSGSLFDVLSGKNGRCGGSYLCTSGSGYDGPTGLGTPNGTGAF